MGFLTEQPVGISGETTEYGCLEEPFKIGLKPRGKKGVAFVDGPYVDE